MKKTFLILLTIASSISITAQEITKQKEIGISYSDLNSFGLSYKFGNSNSVWRINALLISSPNKFPTSYQDDMFPGIYAPIESNEKSIGFSLKFGKEYRKTIIRKLEFRYGADLSFGYNKLETDYMFKPTLNYYSINYYSIEENTYTLGANLILGFNYVVSKNILLGVELLPGFNYVKGTYLISFETEFSEFEYGWSKSTPSALLSLSYKF